MHSIKIAIRDTGRTPRNRGLMLLTYFNFNRNSQPFLTVCFPFYILTISYLRTRGVLLSNTCSEIYGLHYRTPCLSLQHNSVLHVDFGGHSDRGFSSSKALAFSVCTTLPAQ